MEQYNDLFINTPENLEKYLKAATVVSILGGTKSEKDAEVIGRDVAEAGYSIRTGGYAMGAMKGGLIGGSEGLEHKDNDGMIKQKVEGVTAADFRPIEFATKGENISTRVADDPYERLKILIRDADIVVVTEGSIGTELEIYASFAFEAELEIAKDGKAEKPIIFVGENVREKVLSIPKFAEYIKQSANIIFVNTVNDVLANVDGLFEKLKDKKRIDVGM